MSEPGRTNNLKGMKGLEILVHNETITMMKALFFKASPISCLISEVLQTLYKLQSAESLLHIGKLFDYRGVGQRGSRIRYGQVWLE